MKVVQINAVCGTGSTGSICDDLCDALHDTGHECKILFGNGSSNYKHGIKVSNKWLVKLNALRARITGNDIGGCFISTWRIIRFLKRYKPDVVHLHNLHAHYVNLPILCSYLAKHDIPTVITLHDCWFFTGGCTHYTAAGCYRWQGDCENCPGFRNGVKSWFFNRSHASFAAKRKALLSIPRLAVIGVSDWITNEARRSFLQNASILKRIYNWIDTGVFYPRSGNLRQHFNLPEDKFLVLCISAGWHPGTNKFNDLMRLAEELPANMNIILAGYVPSVIQLPSNVIKIGYVSGTEELAKLYSATDIYVHLSQEDTFGKVIVEATACGIPSIVYNSTACPELATPVTGNVVAPGAVESIVKTLQVKQKISKNNNKQIISQSAHNAYAKQPLLKETKQIYQELLSN